MRHICTLVSLSATSAFAKDNKVSICHYLGEGNGNPEYIVIVVSERAVDSHMSPHDDLLLNSNGECGDVPPPTEPPPSIPPIS